MSESGKQAKEKSGGGEKLKPIMSPFSPFPYGSPVQQGTIQSPFSGSPAQKYLLNSFARRNNSRESQANSFSRGNSAEQTVTTETVATPRLRGQDLYGGPVMFGGGSSALRRGRMLSATPYSAALRNREREREKTRPTAPPTPATPTPTTDAMSSTARVILDTLDKMSTPIQDARKIPVPRAEKRKMIEDELNCSLSSLSRRRPRLGSGLHTMLNGPPLRKNYSPVPVRGAASRLGATPSTSSIGVDYERAGGASSGKVKAKVSEKGRAKAMLELTESDHELPSFLTTSVPTLDIKFDKLPEIDLKSSGQTQAKEEGVKASQKAEESPKPKAGGGFNFNSGSGGFNLKPKVGGSESSLESKSGGFTNFESKTGGGFNFEPKTKPSVSPLMNAVTPSTPSANKLSIPNTNAVKPNNYIQDQPRNSLHQPGQKTSLSQPESKPDSSPKTVQSKLPSPPPPAVLPVNNLPTKKRSFSSSTSVNENDEKRPRFSFVAPEIVSNDAAKSVSTKFSFSAPEVSGTIVAVNGKDNAQYKNSESGYSSLNSSSSSLTKVPVMKNHVTSLSPRRKDSSLRHESSLPDVANSVMMFGQGGKQGVDVVRDSPSVASNRLPDVTTSTGFGGISASPSSGFRGFSAKPSSGGFGEKPSAGFGGFSSAPSSGGFGAAKELKTGSVMDILGKK